MEFFTLLVIAFLCLLSETTRTYALVLFVTVFSLSTYVHRSSCSRHLHHQQT